MMFSGGSLPQPVSNDSAVASIVDQLGLGLKQYQDSKRVQMLANPMEYLKLPMLLLQHQQVLFTVELYIR